MQSGLAWRRGRESNGEIIQHVMKSILHLALAASFFSTVVSTSAEDGKKEYPSPDGRFLMKFTGANPDIPFGIFEKESGKLLLKAPDETVNSFTETVACVWSPDSKQFALNCRMGARYNTTLVFRWNGKAFTESPSFETMLSVKLDDEKAKELKEGGFKKDAYQRRIWDSFTVKRWIDVSTLEVDAYSIRAVTISEDDSTDVSGSIRFQLQRDKKGKWKITSQKHVPIEEMEKE